MATKNGVPFRQNLVARSKWPLKAPFAMVPKKATVHNTDNEATASAEINYMNSNNNQVSFHTAIDEKEAVQGLPYDRNGWHSGDGRNGYGNRNTLSYEICRNYDRTRRTTNLLSPLKEQYAQAELNASKVIAQDMYDWNINPVLDNVKYHNDWNGKNCPSKILNEGRGMAVRALIVAEAIKYKAQQEGRPIKDETPSTPSVPSSGNYTVKAGDTLWGIANRYGVTANNLRSWNGISGDLIRPGQTLKLSGSVSQPTPAPQPATLKNNTSYTGTSVVDYLNLSDNKHLGGASLPNRRKLAAANGISNYTGTAAQNTQLLNRLRGGGSSAQSTTKNKKLHLPATAKTWRVYNVNGPYTAANAIHQLTPSAFGGLTYDIIRELGNHLYVINTSVRGNVAIYAGPDTSAKIS